MLNKRMHVLFDEETFNLLNSFAKEQNTSIGKLVRKAVKAKYRAKDLAKEKRNKAIEWILNHKAENISPYTAADLVHMGRKFENND